MAKPIVIRLRAKQRESLQRKRRTHPDPRVQRRAAIVLLSDEDWPVADICAAAGVTRGTVTNVRNRWLADGFQSLTDKPRSGRPPIADGEYLVALLRAVTTAPEELGYAFTVWTTPKLAAHLKRRTGKTLSAESVGDHLRAMGYVWARPKHTLQGKRDERAHRRGQNDLRRLKKGLRAATPPSSSSSSMKPASTSTRTWLGRGDAAVTSTGSPPPARTSGWACAAP